MQSWGRVLAGARDAVHRSSLVVGSREDPHPAILTAAGFAGHAAYLLVADATRRRPVFVVRRDGDVNVVVKVAAGTDGATRGTREQQTLRRLADLGMGSVPQPLGFGRCGDLSWSAESAASGVPLSEVLGRHPRSALESLAGVSDWIGALGAATAMAPPSWESSGELLAGPHRDLIDLVDELPPLPAVLTHGDLGSAYNILVDGASFTVIDWETADDRAPLFDLIPILCLGLASIGRLDAGDRASYLLELCAGGTEQSRWLHQRVREYCRRVGIPLEVAGRLAVLAWAAHATLSHRHAELVRSAGVEVATTSSAADQVARRWMHDPRLGRDWPALRSSD